MFHLSLLHIHVHVCCTMFSYSVQKLSINGHAQTYMYIHVHVPHSVCLVTYNYIIIYIICTTVFWSGVCYCSVLHVHMYCTCRRGLKARVALNNVCVHLYVSQNIRHSEPFAELMLPQPVPLCGDIKIEFYHNSWRGKVSIAVTTHTRVYIIYIHVYTCMYIHVYACIHVYQTCDIA